MPRSRIAIPGSLLFLALATALPAAASEGEVPWSTDIKQAMKTSQSSGKPVFVDVWANWCVPCKHMDDTTYREPAILEAAEAFVPLKVDHDLHEIFVERYRVEGLPAILFIDGEGRLVAHLEGLITVEALLETMDHVLGGYAAYMEQMPQVKKNPSAAQAVASYLLEVGNPLEAARWLKSALKGLKGAAAAEREPVELLLARAQLDSDQCKAAAVAFERLSGSAESAVRGPALAGLVQAQRERGKETEADAALQTLKQEFPGIAARIASGE